MSYAGVVKGPESGLVLREREPLNLESPFGLLDGFLTRTELFYIRNHFEIPRLVGENYALKVEGAVKRPFAVGLEEIAAMPTVTRAATLECAGNSRVFLSPQIGGAQWQLGAVSTAEWTGVPLAALLERAGVNADACEIVFEAADRGTPKEKPLPPGETQYARSIALAKAADVLLAYKMNGEPLTVEHGYPLRAVVPGHYGMASVKWLTHIRAVMEPFRGYWQTTDYAYWAEENGNPVRRALGEMALKSAIARPGMREPVAAGQRYKVAGAAWCGESTIAAVELTTDGGKTWGPVRFLDEARPFVWRRWEFDWDVPTAKGLYVLKSRARDAAGNMQPEEHDKRFGSYVIHHTLGIEVVVR